MCEDEYEHLAAHVIDKLDGFATGGIKDAKISSQELRNLYVEEPEDAVLKGFRDWLMDHPYYKELRMYLVGAPTIVRFKTRVDITYNY